jgi:hypothetical protein
MIKERYKGHEHPEIVGKEALLMPSSTDRNTWLAQFDDRFCSSPDEIDYNHHTGMPIVYPGHKWGFGWHALPREDFEILMPGGPDD